MRFPTPAPRGSKRSRLLPVVLSLLGLSCTSGPDGPAGDSSPAVEPGSFFAREVRPILDGTCVRCHGDRDRKAELDLRTPSGIAAGSESGAVLHAGDPDSSPLYLMVREGKMPPGRNKRLAAREVETIRRWIHEGARF